MISATHPLLKATLTGFRKTYLRFLVFRPKLAETKRFPPILVHMNGKFFLGSSRFVSAKIDLKLAMGGSRPHNNGQTQYWKLIILEQKDNTFRHQWTKYIFLAKYLDPGAKYLDPGAKYWSKCKFSS